MSRAATCPVCDTYSGGPDLDITVADLQDLGHLLPPGARELQRAVGPAVTVALIRVWPGQQILVPRDPGVSARAARRWAQIEAVVGAEAMPAIQGLYGGHAMEVPVCKALLLEKRNRWIRSYFDALTTSRPGEPGMTKGDAVHEIVMALAMARMGVTYRQVERAIDSSDVTGGPPVAPKPSAQMALPFFPPFAPVPPAPDQPQSLAASA